MTGPVSTAAKHLIAAGVSGEELLAAIAEIEASLNPDTAAERRRAYDRERKKHKSRPPIPDEIKRSVYERDGEMCVYCGDTSGPFHLDHMVPYSRGGASDVGNLCVACAPCNLSKGAKTPDEWCQ